MKQLACLITLLLSLIIVNTDAAASQLGLTTVPVNKLPTKKELVLNKSVGKASGPVDSSAAYLNEDQKDFTQKMIEWIKNLLGQNTKPLDESLVRDEI